MGRNPIDLSVRVLFMAAADLELIYFLYGRANRIFNYTPQQLVSVVGQL
jgi:hypothetical protein